MLLLRLLVGIRFEVEFDVWMRPLGDPRLIASCGAITVEDGAKVVFTRY